MKMQCVATLPSHIFFRIIHLVNAPHFIAFIIIIFDFVNCCFVIVRIRMQQQQQQQYYIYV